MLYNSLILPHIQYCNLIWAGTYSSSLNKILMYQKRAIRICTYTNRKSSSNELFYNYKILPIFDIYKLQIVKLMYSVFYKLHPSSVCCIFNTANTIHEYLTRNTFKFYKQLATKNVRKFCPTIAGPILWDSLSDEIKSSYSIHGCMKNYKLFLLEKDSDCND